MNTIDPVFLWDLGLAVPQYDNVKNKIYCVLILTQDCHFWAAYPIIDGGCKLNCSLKGVQCILRLKKIQMSTMVLEGHTETHKFMKMMSLCMLGMK